MARARREGTPAGGAAAEPVAARDGIWLQDSAENLMVINALYTLERIDLDSLRELWRKRVLEAGAGSRFDRFRKRIDTIGGRDHWVWDDTFDLSQHVVSAPLGRTVSEAELQRYVGQEAGRPLPRGRPPWQVQLVEHYERDESAVLVRVHHCMGDGLGLIPVLLALLDREELSSGGAGELPTRVGAGRNTRRSPGQIAAAALVGPMLILLRLLSRRDLSPLHGTRPSGRKRVCWLAPLSLDQIRMAKVRHGATVNDVLMTAVGGAIGRYLAQHGAAELSSVRAVVPVNVRRPTESDQMDNRFAAVILDLPVQARSVAERLAATKRTMDRIKRSTEPLVMYGSVRVVLGLLPRALGRWLIDVLASKCTLIVTNVPGPQRVLYSGGRRMNRLMFWVPQRADIGLGVSIFTYSNLVQIAFMCDEAVVPDPEAMIAAFAQEFTDLVAADG